MNVRVLHPAPQARLSRFLLTKALGQAWRATLAYRLRSVFVILAVSLGIASLSVIAATMEGAGRKIDELVSIFGPDAAFVQGGNMFSRAVGQRTRTISHNDVNAMRRSLPGVYVVAPMSFKSSVSMVNGNRNYQKDMIMGSAENYCRAWDWPLGQGRDISAADMERAESVVILGAEIARELFGDESPVERGLLLAKIPFKVIGVLSPRGASGSDQMDYTVVVPLSTMIRRFNQDRQYFRTVRLKFEDPSNMEAHAANVTSLLRHLHGLGEGQTNDFSIVTSLDIQRFIGMLKNGLSVFLGITALAAMCVSGFVLANLFYISVSERGAEVGLRKAVGAPSLAITLQFLCEAVLLTLGGAALGLVWGMLIGLTVDSALFSIEFSGSVFMLSLAAAVLVGIVFGLRPARRAAALEPISALKGQA